jgi:transposase-like protein
MRPYSAAVKADVRRRLGPPSRQSVVEFAQELGFHAITLDKGRTAWRLQGEVVPASEKEAESWSAADKFTVGLETVGLNATELGGDCRGRDLYPGQVDRWRKAAPDANAQPLLTMSDQKDLQKRHQEAQRDIKRLQQELRRKDKALAEAAALLTASKKIQAYWGQGGEDCQPLKIARGPWRSRKPGWLLGPGRRPWPAFWGVGLRTLQRWRRQFAGDGDGVDRGKGAIG